MRRLFAAAVVCAAVLLVMAPAALALTAPLHGAAAPGPAKHNLAARSQALRAPAAFVPLARRILTGSGTISLNVYSFLGQPEVGADTNWWVSTVDDYGTGSGVTDVNGHVDMTGVPAATSANGEIAVLLDPAVNPDNGAYDLWNLSWGDTGWIGGLQPGLLPVPIVRSSEAGWNTWSAARVWLWAENADQVHLARTDITPTGPTTYGNARTITTGPETLTAGALYFWDNQGLELPVSGLAVSPGVQADWGPTAYQSQAQRVWMDYWGSGKPGTRTWLALNNYPAGWLNHIAGVADYPRSARVRDFGTFTTTGRTNDDWKRITIPSTAAPGYAYWVWASHDDGPLSLQTWFQTCTLKPSKATVYKGTSISLSGIVPIKGHYGSKRGTRKYVTIYKTTSATTARYQPNRTGGATVRGWTKVARVRTDGLGKYRKGSVSVPRTTWYCAWYPGDSWYWGAWTSVAKVTAR
jgi:hypothetical protein